MFVKRFDDLAQDTSDARGGSCQMVASDGDEPVIPRVVPGKMGGRLTALFGMYGCCSISMTLLNKQLALEYPYPSAPCSVGLINISRMRG